MTADEALGIDELEGVAVAGDDDRRDRCSRARSASVAMTSSASKPADARVRVAERLDERLEVRPLLLEQVRPRRAPRLVLGVDLLAPAGAGVPDDDRRLRAVLGEDLHEHRGEAEDRVRRNARRRRDRLGQREERPVDERVAVDQVELVGAVGHRRAHSTHTVRADRSAGVTMVSREERRRAQGRAQMSLIYTCNLCGETIAADDALRDAERQTASGPRTSGGPASRPLPRRSGRSAAGTGSSRRPPWPRPRAWTRSRRRRTSRSPRAGAGTGRWSPATGSRRLSRRPAAPPGTAIGSPRPGPVCSVDEGHRHRRDGPDRTPPRRRRSRPAATRSRALARPRQGASELLGVEAFAWDLKNEAGAQARRSRAATRSSTSPARTSASAGARTSRPRSSTAARRARATSSTASSTPSRARGRSSARRRRATTAASAATSIVDETGGARRRLAGRRLRALGAPGRDGEDRHRGRVIVRTGHRARRRRRRAGEDAAAVQGRPRRADRQRQAVHALDPPRRPRRHLPRARRQRASSPGRSTPPRPSR